MIHISSGTTLTEIDLVGIHVSPRDRKGAGFKNMIVFKYVKSREKAQSQILKVFLFMWRNSIQQSGNTAQQRTIATFAYPLKQTTSFMFSDTVLSVAQTKDGHGWPDV